VQVAGAGELPTVIGALESSARFAFLRTGDPVGVAVLAGRQRRVGRGRSQIHGDRLLDPGQAAAFEGDPEDVVVGCDVDRRHGRTGGDVENLIFVSGAAGTLSCGFSAAAPVRVRKAEWPSESVADPGPAHARLRRARQKRTPQCDTGLAFVRCISVTET
jgi:hypothetical protein